MTSVYKYCLVPTCKNTTCSAPDKIYFQVPKDADLRKKWCKVIGREGDLSLKSTVHCCEDHFNIEDDTRNYMEYKIMGLQEGYKTSLRLKKGIVPHKLLCQQQTSDSRALKKQRIQLDEAASNFEPSKESVEFVNVTVNSQTDYGVPSEKGHQDCHTDPLGMECHSYAVGPSKFALRKEPENIKILGNNPGPSIRKVDGAIQVKVHYSSIGVKAVNVTLCNIKNAEGSPLPVLRQNAATSTSSLRNNYSQECESITSDFQPSVSGLPVPLDFEPPSSDSSLSEEDNSEEENFKNTMRSSTMMAIKKEPKLLIGVPKKSYYLIEVLSESTSLAKPQ